MVLGLHREALVRRVEARALRHGPALQHALELEPEVVVQPRGGVALDVVAQPFPRPGPRLAARLRRDREVAHLAIPLKSLRHWRVSYSKACARAARAR